MRITLCGSIDFSNRMIDIEKILSCHNITVELPYTTWLIKNQKIDLNHFIEEKQKNGDLFFRNQNPGDTIKTHFDKIKQSNAILVINQDKNNIKNYIGANTLTEMAFAYYLDKTIYLLNPIPKISYRDEIQSMHPIIINNSLSVLINDSTQSN